MSPYEIDILLWYHSRLEDHPDIDRNPPVWSETIKKFRAEQLLVDQVPPNFKFPRCYEPTNRLHAYVDSICNVALPGSQWVTVYPADGPQGLSYGVPNK